MTNDGTTTGWYTFGNHFHWVDMQWLWGNGVLARSVDDMLAFIERTGAPGNINFDGIGYEKLASEEPSALARLVAAVGDGRVEVVGGSYGQPYAQFHHGESAVRQLSYGVRTAVRLLGVRPRAFWEEEFYFFPQLPQLLRDAGYTGASLFFQWTWHTPELPRETAPAIRWRGIDGTEIPTLPRSELNLHQWPEDVEALIAGGGLERFPTPVVQQWLELLPSPDWMCRSEIVVPGVERLLATPGVDFRLGTLSTVIAAVEKQAVVREYGMDEVFHGMSLGKNGNRVHRVSRELEHLILAAEAVAVRTGVFGRPYAQWSKYPSWELEEAWRELLAFQHHDNDECEGLCGHIGYLGADRGRALAHTVLERNLRRLAARVGGAGSTVLINPLGWERDAVLDGQLRRLPAFGALVANPAVRVPEVSVSNDGERIRLLRGDFEIEVDAARGVVTKVGGVSMGPEGVGLLQWRRAGVTRRLDVTSVEVIDDVVAVHTASDEARVRIEVRIAGELDALDLRFTGDLGEGPDGRAHAALMTLFEPDLAVAEVRHDTPYAVSAIEGRSRWHRKYPTGDWMTSPQEFEEVVDAFSALQLVDLVDEDGSGVLWAHDGSQAFHRAQTGVWNVLSMRDPWDEHYFVRELDARVRVVPHGAVTDAWRWKTAQEFARPAHVVTVAADDAVVLAGLDAKSNDVVASTLVQPKGDSSVALTAMYRDSDFQAVGLETHVNRIARDPVLLRLVELDGRASSVVLHFSEPLLGAWRCTALGEVLHPLDIDGDSVSLQLDPHAIATIAVAHPPAPGDNKTLDDDRAIWAMVHHEAD